VAERWRCIVCGSVHWYRVTTPRDSFQVGKAKLCCLATFSAAIMFEGPRSD